MRTLAAFVLAFALGAQAQMVPKPYASGATRGQVLDAESGRAIPGAVVVARWDWLAYTPPGFHSSGGYSLTERAMHIGEAVTDGEGRYSIAAWGPVIRASGRVPEDAPAILVFRSGYEPLRANGTSAAALRLRRATGDAASVAKGIAEFQQRELRWTTSADGPALPAMSLAMHAERLRLGGLGEPILGAHRMPGREGKGAIVDAATRKEGPGGVIWVEWTMRRSDGAVGTRRVVQTQRPPGYGAGSTFFVSPWRLPGPQVAGWVVDPSVKPTVRVYPYGAKRSAAVTWEEQGGAVTVEKLGQTKEELLAELQARRRDIDGQLGTGNRAETLVLLGPLLDQLDHDCRRLTPDLQANLCFDPASDVGRAIMAARRQSVDRVEEGEHGLKIVTRVQDAGGGGTAANAVASGPGPPQVARKVGGFTIEPIR